MYFFGGGLCRLLGFSEEMSWHRGLQKATQETRRVLEWISRLGRSRIYLVGGWTNPFEEYARQNGWKKRYLKPPPSYHLNCCFFRTMRLCSKSVVLCMHSVRIHPPPPKLQWPPGLFIFSRGYLQTFTFHCYWVGGSSNVGIYSALQGRVLGYNHHVSKQSNIIQVPNLILIYHFTCISCSSSNFW